MYITILNREATPTTLTLDHGDFLNNNCSKLNQSGKTDPNAVVTINGENLTADRNGNFYKIIDLKTGNYTINISSKSFFKTKTDTYINIGRTQNKTGASGSWEWNGTVQQTS